ncbi:MAG: hypothetical protein ACYC35_11660 [Pirellulales bacterium]
MEAEIMSLVLDRPARGQLLSDAQWMTTDYERPRPQRSESSDISSAARKVEIPFGASSLVFGHQLPQWFGDLLERITELGNLEENWDSYGARPIDPRCAVATADLLLSLLDATTPKPFIVPTTRGGIQLEWHRAGADLEIRIESPARWNVYFEDQREGGEKEMTLTGNLGPLRQLLKRLGEQG